MPDDHAESVVHIDENNLDKECVSLPTDYLKYARLSAEAKKDVDELAAELKVIHSDLSKDIRANPEDYGFDKVTETGLASAILSLPRYTKAAARLRQAEHEHQMAQAVVWALEAKKRSLTLLVDLHGMGYFSSVTPSKEGKAAIEKMTTRRIRSSNDG